MTQQEYAPPQPTAEHKKLLEATGTWNVDCTFYVDPSQPPMKTKGKETVKPFGEFWTTSTFEADLGGMPFQGTCTIGYEPHNKRWVSTWFDVCSPSLFYMTGNFDKSGKTLTMKGHGLNCATGKDSECRTVDKWTSPDDHTVEMFATMPDGKEAKLFTNVYKRKR